MATPAMAPPLPEFMVEERIKKLNTSSSYLVAVQTKDNGNAWARNALRFEREADAKAYGEHLKLRWTAVTAVYIDTSDDHPNATFPVPSDRYLVLRKAEKAAKRKYKDRGPSLPINGSQG